MGEFFRAFFRSWLPGFRYVLLSWAAACALSAVVMLLAGIAYGNWMGPSFAALFCFAGLALLFVKSRIDAWLQRGEG